MKKQSFFAPVLVAACAATIFSSCKKGRPGDGPLTADFAPVENVADAQAAIATATDAIYETLAASPAVNDAKGDGQFGTCPVVTFAPKSAADSFPATLTVDFGTGCNWRGHQCSGKVVLTVSGKMTGGNATATASIANLTVDGSTVAAQIELKTGAQGLRSFTYTVTGGSVTTDDGNTTTLDQLTCSRTMTGGQSTTVQSAGPAALTDDVFELTVSGAGANSLGKAYTISTPVTVVRRLDCRWLSTGRMEVKSALTTSSIDFGTGDCDNKAVLTIGNETKDIELP